MKSPKLTLHPSVLKTSLRALLLFCFIASANYSALAQGGRYLSFSPSSLNFTVNQNGTTPAKVLKLSASRGNPDIRLSKSSRSNWLVLPSSPALGDLSFSINSAGLNPGTYLTLLTAKANNFSSSSILVVLKVNAITTLPSIVFNHPSDTVEVPQGGTQSLLEYISTSNSAPASVSLTAAGEDGNVPSWLSVNGNLLNGINYTTGSEITFSVDATTLSVGTYIANVTAASNGYNSGILNIIATVKAGSTGILTDIKVNFQDAATIPPSGWINDFGQPFGPRSSTNQGVNNVYGWIKRSDGMLLDLTLNGRKRNTPASDTLLSTLLHMQGNDIANFTGTKTEGVWEAQVANGVYDVTVSVGDGTAVDSRHSLNVEGVPAIVNFVPTTSVRFKSATISVSVADGLLTLDAIGGKNTKINYIIIKPTTTRRPSVVVLTPENGSQNVSENTSVSTAILNLPNGGIDNTTILPANVYLTEALSGNVIAANVNGTGGGDAITLVPSGPLKLSTAYEIHITDGVKDLSGASFIPYSSTFTTGALSTTEIINAKFNKVALPNTTGRHSSLTIGPDGKLYALSIDGVIKRFIINADGTLQTPELLYALQDAYGARQSRLAIGFAFAPEATASNLIVYITHSTFVFLNGPDWDGKLTKLSGPNLENVQDILINLPRSAKDHLTNSIAFGPDGGLYFTQGCNSAMGRADQTWSLRDEHLLSAAVLKLDLQKLSSLPLNVKTPEGGGPYNPYAPNAPLIIYASGVRNAYDLVWHSNGKLYVPANGSAAGGNTPGSLAGAPRTDGTVYNGPAIPALTNLRQTQKDFLFRIDQGGYYGHPNPLRGEFVMNGGNPTSSIETTQVDDYPIGTLPDANYRGISFDLQANKSPNGAIEYKSKSFHGALQGKLMVVRYSQNDDIITLTPGGPNKDIVSYNEGASIEGFSGFVDPLDLTEDTATGNIYVSEYGGDGMITLLTPTVPPSQTPELNVEVAPGADAYVRNGSYASINFGLDTILAAKTYNKSTGYTRSSYIKFPLAGVTDIVAAKIRIYGRNPETALVSTLSLFGLDNDAWTETGITFNNAPPVAGNFITTFAVNGVNKYFELDVTNFVKAQFAADKIVSFVIKDTANQNIPVNFNSRENSINRPQLILTTSAVAVPGNAKLTVENLDKFPSDQLFVASRIHVPWTRDVAPPKIYNANHDTVKIRLNNKGTGNLTVTNLVRSNTRNWNFLKVNGITYDSSTAFPMIILPGTTLDITLQFVEPAKLETRYKLFSDNLTIYSNDDSTPARMVYMNGMWVRGAEGNNEPKVQEMITAFGFKTSTGFASTDADKGNPQKPKGNEIITSHFVRADISKPVEVIQMAAYHECCRNLGETINWYEKTNDVPVLIPVVKHRPVDGQSILPRKETENAIATGTFEPVTPFGFKIGTLDWTDTLRNPEHKIGIRIWKAIDGNGVVIADAYIVANDYLGTSFTNYDYNDNVYYLKNVKPEPVVIASPATLSVTDAIQDLNTVKNPLIYPNPLRNKFTVLLPEVYKGNVRLQISDITGRRFELGKYNYVADGSGIEVNISKLALKPGIYLLSIKKEAIKTKVVKLIIR